MRFISLTCAAMAAAVLTACAAPSPSEAPGAEPGQLAGTHWQADVVGGKSCALPSTVEFMDGDRAGGSLGCNRYTAVYELKGSALKFGSIASTRKLCAPDFMHQEASFAQVLEATRSARRDGDTLTLYGADHKPLIQLAPEKPASCN